MKNSILSILLIINLTTLKAQDSLDNVTFPSFSIEGFESERSENNIFNYILMNIKYPDKAKENCISGTVLMRFTIDTLGYVINDTVLIDQHPLLINAAKQTFYSTSGKWTPATKNGVKVSMPITLPFKFRLKGAGCVTETEYFRLGLGYFEKEDYVNATNHFKEALKHDPYNKNYLYNLAASYLKQYKIDTACSYLKVLPLDEDLKAMKKKFCE